MASIAVVLQLPVGRRGDDEMNRFILQFAHVAAVAEGYGGVIPTIIGLFLCRISSSLKRIS
jgi:hypothetical protein